MHLNTLFKSENAVKWFGVSDPDDIALIGYQYLINERGVHQYIPGIINNIIVFLSIFLPKKISLPIISWSNQIK
jgi:hypothetical protein